MPQREDRIIRRVDAERIAKLSEVSEEDVEAARLSWGSDAPSGFKKLLDAKPRE